MKRDLSIVVIFLVIGFVCGWNCDFFLKHRDRDRIKTLSAQIAEQRKTILAYQRALIGEETDLLSIYDKVTEAEQVDIIVHSDTESGLPSKFQIKCEVKE